MIGLLRKDQTLLWSSYSKNFLVVLLLYSAMMLASDSMIFVMYALVFLGGLYTTSTLMLDEQSQWDTYARTLPVTAGQIVGSKYLLTVAWAVLCFGLSELLCTISGLVHGTLADNWPNYLAGSLAALALVFFYNALTLPLSYKFGAARARNFTMVTICLIVGLTLLGGAFLTEKIGTVHVDVIVVDSVAGMFLVIGTLLGVSLLLFAVSWAVSVAIYRNRTF